ncbi:phosphatidate cytidylyltransferase [Limimonas halophila]|uniref:Phosphatidate cytidylyltransferase n=2 Tax=Limimonas halophila TaxID=1082479 RepID=A0A1G7N9G8_9PROT|nr:phosphatidate cytidylyltransferase [Limimonas halophila]
MAQPSKPAKSGSLRKRVISGVVLAPLVLLVIYAGPLPTAALVLLAAMAMAGELTDTAGGADRPVAVPIAVAAISLVVIFAVTTTWPAVFVVAAAGGALAGLILRGRAGLVTASAFAYVAIACAAAIWLRQHPDIGGALLIWLLVLVWATDVGAFVAGRALGGWRLAPHLSPNKTWAGLLGGMGGAAVLSAASVAAFPVLGEVPWLTSLPAAAAMGAGLAVVEQGGDLLESAWKRYFHVKDSGVVIPGHGGILDRTDGLLAVILAVAALHLLLGTQA